MQHAVLLPPGFLAPFMRPGPAYIVTSSFPYVTVAAPVADPGPSSTTVPRFLIQPGSSSVPLPIPSTLAQPGPATHAPPMPAFPAPPTFLSGWHAVAPAQVSACLSTAVSTWDVPSAAAPPTVPETSGAPAWFGDLTMILKQTVKKKTRSRKVSSSSSSSSSSSAASPASPSEASQPKKKKPASPPPRSLALRLPRVCLLPQGRQCDLSLALPDPRIREPLPWPPGQSHREPRACRPRFAPPPGCA
ncbi:uncharacterized protein [Macrobrachium rosenbergii]|uniref:uncharacterized protein n=1 Tax=Macrobrachium rosenbergii TaxID=79674 RepID=UPI0034D64C11